VYVVSYAYARGHRVARRRVVRALSPSLPLFILGFLSTINSFSFLLLSNMIFKKLILLLLISGSFSFVFKIPKNNIPRRNPSSSKLRDIPMIPAIIGTTVLVFGIFNIDNPVDLTDQGVFK